MKRPALFVAVSVLVAACGAAPASTTIPSASPGATVASPPAVTASAPPAEARPTPSPSVASGIVSVRGSDVVLECRGEGSPTVVFEAGLNTSGAVFAPVVDAIAPTTRACWYDRPGVGGSEAVQGATALSAGDRVDELHDLLATAGVQGPYVLAGHSYGGMVVRLFAVRYPEETAGIVLVDASHEDQFRSGSWWNDGSTWRDGSHPVDKAATREQLLAANDLGELPEIVLTNGRMTGDAEREWSPLQDALAAMSDTSLHMVATESGHDIPVDRPELVREAVLAVVATARDGSGLPACAPRFETVGAECLATTLADRITEWDAARAAFTADAGSLPAGRYAFKDGDVDVTIELGGGRLAAELRDAGGVERFEAEYAASEKQVVFRWPFDWRMPRTPGLNTARWSVDDDGSLRFEQTDDHPAEPWLQVPWKRVGV